jgi:DNA-binding transcriptional MerR regulator
MERDPDTLLPIGAFATAAQLSIKALRLYARLDILQPAYVDPGTGYRYYRGDQLTTARRIRLMRQMAMPLALIRRALSADQAGAAALIEAYRASVEAQAALVRQASGELVRQLWQEGTAMEWQVEVRQEEPGPVVSIERRVRVGELDEYRTGSISALRAYAAQHGATERGIPFSIYHGAVNQEDDGPVEVCLPVDRVLPAVGEFRAQALPPARLASVTARGEQCHFPAILGGYDATYDWIERNGYKPAGSPREIYRGTVEGGPVEIAWPFEEQGDSG